MSITDDGEADERITTATGHGGRSDPLLDRLKALHANGSHFTETFTRAFKERGWYFRLIKPRRGHYRPSISGSSRKRLR